MQPNNKSDDQRGTLHPPERRDAQAQAVANMTRDQIDSIYSKQAAEEQQTAGQESPHSAYERTHQDAHQANAEAWRQYHSQWQQYYQKYYERYYVGEVQRAHGILTEHARKLQEVAAARTAQESSPQNESLSPDEAMYDLRSQLLNKVQNQAKKVRKSRHFMPAIAGLAVLLIVLFLQYNNVLFATVIAYTSPGNIDPQNIIVDPNASTQAGPENVVIIPKINVDIPVDYNAQPTQDSQNAAMNNGLAYFGITGANSKPGQLGNVPIAGHSMNDFTDVGKYKFAFTLLPRMQQGDTFYIDYQGTRYTYVVRYTKTVAPDDVSALNIGTSKAMATLITCVPIGTANSRLLVFGEQISPSVTTAQQAPAQSPAPSSNVTMAGNGPSFLEKLFGAN